MIPTNWNLQIILQAALPFESEVMVYEGKKSYCFTALSIKVSQVDMFAFFQILEILLII